MNTILKLEELGVFILGIFLFSQLHMQWWWFPALILAPDLSMLGYIAGNATGAFMYNLFHHKGIAVALYLVGVYTGINWLMLAGLILLLHASLDRIFGYGLKYVTGFQYTHLGIIGKEKMNAH